MTQENNSGLIPVGTSIVVLPDQVDEKSEGGIILATESELDRYQMRQTDAKVVAISPRAFYDERNESGEIISRCVVGDKVIIAAFSGMVRKGIDGLTYRIIHDTDVVAILGEDND